MRIQKQKTSNSKKGMRNTDNITAEFSNDEWMLMGYMAYAHDNYVQSRHIKNTADLVNDVSEDLTNGDLKATKSSDTSKQLKKPNYVFVMFLITILTLILHLRLNHQVAKKVAVMIKVVNPINQVGLLPKKHIFTIL